MQRQDYLIAGLVTILLAGILFLSGCPQTPPANGAPPANGGAPPADGGLTGTAGYAGTWTGTWLGSSVSGSFELTVNFDGGTVSGSMNSGYPGDITGTVSEGVMSASGNVAGYAVTWSGNISPDGSSIGGDWQRSVATAGSGTWTGTRST